MKYPDIFIYIVNNIAFKKELNNCLQ